MEKEINYYLKKYKNMKREREFWETHWQILGEYVHMRRQDFNSSHSPGEFLHDDIFDSTAPYALEIMVNALIGALWPSGARSFRLKPPKSLPDTDEIKKFYAEVSRRIADAMDATEAGLALALEEYMLELGSFGTGGIGVFPSESGNAKLSFKSWSIRFLCIAESESGFVNTIYYEEELTLDQAMERYGLENLHEETKKKIMDSRDSGGSNDKLKILRIIEPRTSRDPEKQNNLNMPWLSLHIDLKNKHVLRETGFDSMPIKVARMIKNSDEKYGRSPAMAALPDIRMLNTVREAYIVATEKNLDPPLAVFDDGRLGPGTINTSAGGVNVFRVTGRITNETPIAPIFTVGDIKQVEELMTYLKESITQHFKIDRLLDLNNETEMTFGEAQIRNNLRAGTLRNVFSRQISELFNPLIVRAFDILFASGELGVLPGSSEEIDFILKGYLPDQILYIPEAVAIHMAQGRDAYEIEYVTPAMRMMQADEAEGILRLWEFLIQGNSLNPEIMDNVDTDETIRTLSSRLGVPETLLRGMDMVKKIRSARAEEIARQQKLETARSLSESGRNFGQMMTGVQGAGQQKAG